MVGISIKQWIEKRKEYLAHIKSFSIGDSRIKTTTQIGYMHGAILESVTGWTDWINSMIGTELNKSINIDDKNALILTDEELCDLHVKYKEFAVKYIELDIVISEIVSKKLSKRRPKWPIRNEEIDKKMIA